MLNDNRGEDREKEKRKKREKNKKEKRMKGRKERKKRKIWFGLFNGISTLYGLFNAKILSLYNMQL